MPSDMLSTICDFEFHFTSGALLCVTAAREDVSIVMTDVTIELEIREPGVTRILTVERTTLNAFQRTNRVLIETQVTTYDDAGRLKIVGAL